jgi:hypothetical protein
MRDSQVLSRDKNQIARAYNQSTFQRNPVYMCYSRFINTEDHDSHECFFVYFLRDEPGIMRELLPDIPATIICIPVISSAIAIINATNLTPSAGDAIINMPKTISSAPTPILNHLDQLWLSLSLNPCITLEMPFIKSATPISIIRNIVVPNGNAVTIIASMITNIPRPTLVHRDDLLLRNIPVIMVSIPTISKRIPTKNTIDATASPGKASMYIDKTTEIAPNPI